MIEKQARFKELSPEGVEQLRASMIQAAGFILGFTLLYFITFALSGGFAGRQAWRLEQIPAVVFIGLSSCTLAFSLLRLMQPYGIDVELLKANRLTILAGVFLFLAGIVVSLLLNEQFVAAFSAFAILAWFWIKAFSGLIAVLLLGCAIKGCDPKKI